MSATNIDELMSDIESKASKTSSEEKVYKIVMVDDVKTISSSMKRELAFVNRKKENIRLVITDFQDPEVAVDYLKKYKPDLLISDIKMPYLSGDKLVETIKKVYPDLPVIVVTGFATKENILSVYKSDKDSIILSKPWAPERFIEAVNQLLGTDFSWTE